MSRKLNTISSRPLIVDQLLHTHSRRKTISLMPPSVIHSDIRSVFRLSSPIWILAPDLTSHRLSARLAITCSSLSQAIKKPSICTADELHYVSVANSDWRLALWRYTPPPPPLVSPRNHPLLLLSGVGTNAIGYDLSPECSFARHMSSQGFDTWVLEFRGAGLSMQGFDSEQIEQTANAISDKTEVAASGAADGVISAIKESLINDSAGVAESKLSQLEGDLMATSVQVDESELQTNMADTFVRWSEQLSGFLSDGQIKFNDLQEGLISTIKDFQKQLDLNLNYDWDFDHYLEEDVPAAMEYVIAQSMPNDGKLLAIGHSMGGILLYALLSRCGADGRDSNLAGVVTLASSLDYTKSKSALKLLLPLADSTQALNLPVPLGTLLAAAYPLSSSPPFALSWLNNLISSEGMMHPELMKKFIFNNFCTIPAKLLLQLTTSFGEGGLCNREGTFFYKDHLHKTNVPILALAGDQDLICPPEAVYETAILVPKHLITYEVFGKPAGPHYAHYDLVGGKLAGEHLYPCIIDFLIKHDSFA